jgi:hypothetical protein
MKCDSWASLLARNFASFFLGRKPKAGVATTIIGVDKVEGVKVLLVHDYEGLGKCEVGASHSHEGFGAGKRN